MLNIIGSWNHRRIWVGRDLSFSPSPPAVTRNMLN